MEEGRQDKVHAEEGNALPDLPTTVPPHTKKTGTRRSAPPLPGRTPRTPPAFWRLQVADLRRLLELYQRWQRRFFPSTDFDTFVLKLEALGRSNQVKVRRPEPTAGRRGG